MIGVSDGSEHNFMYKLRYGGRCFCAILQQVWHPGRSKRSPTAVSRGIQLSILLKRHVAHHEKEVHDCDVDSFDSAFTY